MFGAGDYVFVAGYGHGSVLGIFEDYIIIDFVYRGIEEIEQYDPKLEESNLERWQECVEAYGTYRRSDDLNIEYPDLE